MNYSASEISTNIQLVFPNAKLLVHFPVLAMPPMYFFYSLSPRVVQSFVAFPTCYVLLALVTPCSGSMVSLQPSVSCIMYIQVLPFSRSDFSGGFYFLRCVHLPFIKDLFTSTSFAVVCIWVHHFEKPLLLIYIYSLSC